MTELSIGEFRKSDFAEWFGISPNTLRNGQGSKYWDILSLYAKYKMTYHTIIIEEIYGSTVYKKQNDPKEKDLKGNLKQYIREHFDEILNGRQIIDNLQEVAKEYYEKTPVLQNYYTAEYFAKVFSEVKRILYGTVQGKRGEIGTSKYICCVFEDGEYKPLKKEESDNNREIQQKKIEYARISAIEIFAFIQEHKDDEDFVKKIYEKYPIEEILEYEGKSSNKIYQSLYNKPLKRCTLLKKDYFGKIAEKGEDGEDTLF